MRLADLASRAFRRRKAPANHAMEDLFGPADPEQLKDDPLLAALACVAQQFGLPFSRAAATAGLPLRDGRLSVDLFPRAAERIGLDARLIQRTPTTVPGVVAPYIVLFSSGDAGVITEKNADGDRARMINPTVSGTARSVSLASIDRDSIGYVLYVTPLAEAGSAAAGRPARDGHWFWSVVWRFWPSWTQIIIAAFAINLLGLALPLFVMNVYDRVIPNLAIPTLWALTAGVAIALLFDLVLKQVRALVLDATGRRVDMAAGSALFEQVLGLSMAARSRASGALANQVREFETVRDFFTSASIIAFSDFAFIGIFIAMLWLIVGPLALVPAIAVPVVIVLTLIAQIPLARSVRRSQAQASQRHSILVDALAGAETVKAVGAEGTMQRRWEESSAATTRAHSGARLWSSLVINLTGYIQQMVSVIIIVWGVFLVAEGTITIGALIAANILAGRVLAPLGGIAQTLTRAQAAITAIGALNALMRQSTDNSNRAGSSRTVSIGSAALKEVTFTYPGTTKPVLSDVSFAVKAGERVGIVGRLGSGKTTIGRLLAGLYLPDEGTVLVDAIDARQFDIAELRAGIGYVGQDAELFAGTIRDNITIGRPDASESEIETAVHLAGVDRFTEDNPLGLSMPVGERGRGLSGGQRQAIALARTLLRQPRILFLDEPSASMDVASERALIERLQTYRDGECTLMVCTHRGAFLELVDRLVVVEAGRIVSDGPKDAVLKALQARKFRM